jgi:hypothetical protein
MNTTLDLTEHLPPIYTTTKLNPTPHLNRSRVKRTALELAAANRHTYDGKPRFTRVSATFLERIEARVREAIRSEVHSHPSVGKTLQ